MLIGYVQNGIALGNDWKPKLFDINGSPQQRRFFDEMGNFILGVDEKMLFSADGVKVDIWDDWAPSNIRGTGKYVFKGYRGPGIIYVTNQRIFHVRAMDPLQAGLDHAGTGGLPGALLDPMLARRAKELSIFEYFELSTQTLVEILLVDESQGKIGYYYLEEWNRYRMVIECSIQIQLHIFHTIESLLKQKELRRYPNGPATSISYSKRGETHVKLFWMRDDLIKKAEKYEKKGKPDKAIAQYQKILEIFPDDESTKERILNCGKRAVKY